MARWAFAERAPRALEEKSVAGFENFLADLVRNEEPVAHGQVDAGPPPSGRLSRLVAQVLDEVVNASVLIAVVTAIANASEKNAGLLRRAGIAIYTPSEPPFSVSTSELQALVRFAAVLSAAFVLVTAVAILLTIAL